MLTTLAASGEGVLVQLDLLIVLACAGAVTLILSRLRVPVIPAYLLAGIVIGPSGFGLITSHENIEQVGHLALIVLMFSIGMHLDTNALRKGAVSIITIGVLSTLATTAGFWGLLSMTPMTGSSALAVAMALAMSSTAVVLKLLSERRELQSTGGRIALGILLVQDLILIVYLALLPLIAQFNQQETTGEIVSHSERVGSMLFAVGVVAAMIVIGRLVLPRMLREASRLAGGEVMLVLTAAVGLGAATLTAWVGLSPELGAFIAGFLLASTPFKYQLSGQLAPVRDLFMAVFFTAVGLQVDIDTIIPLWWVVPVGVVGMMVLKAVTISVTAWAVGVQSGLAGRSGILLAQGGEFSLIVVGVSVTLGLVSSQESSLLVAVVIASLILTTSLVWIAKWAEPVMGRVGRPPWRKKDSISDEPDAENLSGHAIIAGYGLVGQACTARLEEGGVDCVIVDLNHKTIHDQTAKGKRMVFGDIANSEVLESAGVRSAMTVVLTLPDSDATMRAIHTIRQMCPHLHIAVRVAVERRAQTAREIGADLVVTEESIMAKTLADLVLEQCQVNDEQGTKASE
ncbi:MAG: cation:proton antiporter [Phycisphaerales bacterium]|nr:cation:proton antiporter [Phycisphaerales bacterium]